MSNARMPTYLIRRIHRISTQLFMLRVGEAGFELTPVQFAALEALQHAPGLDQTRLAEAMGKDRATTGKVVDALEQKQLVARLANGKDRRVRLLRLTDSGERTLRALSPVIQRLQKETLSGLSSAEYKQFVDLAAKAIASTRVDSAGNERNAPSGQHG